jgi:hypothetical protein
MKLRFLQEPHGVTSKKTAFSIVTALHIINRLGSVTEQYYVYLSCELWFYILEDDILHSHRRENLKSYIALTGLTL